MSALAIPTTTLNNGVKIPLLAFGVGTIWNKNRLRLEGKTPTEGINQHAIDIVFGALQAGHRHIDTAENYETEAEVGEALRRFFKANPNLTRKDIFITTKIFRNAKTPEKALADSLEKLGVDYVDLYLVHAPELSRFDANIEDLWPELEKFYKQGKVRAIGVSNFSIEQLEHLSTFATVSPAANQIEYHPYLQARTPGVVEYAQKHNILVEAYGPLGALTLKDYKTAPLTPVLERLADKYNKTPAQISLKWVNQTGVLAITTTSKIERVGEALGTLDFELTSDEVAEITSIGKTFHHRQYTPFPVKSQVSAEK